TNGRRAGLNGLRWQVLTMIGVKEAPMFNKTLLRLDVADKRPAASDIAGPVSGQTAGRSTSELGQFERDLQTKDMAAQQRGQPYDDQVQQRTSKLLQRCNQFGRMADSLLRTVIRPRVEKVAACLGNGELLPVDAAQHYRCTCRFEPAGRFPSTTNLSVAVSH